MGAEPIELPDVHATEVDGVPAYWASSDGPIHASLLFDGGICIEPVALRGIQHLVEHLVLSRVGPQAYHHNGYVDLRRTAFMVRGDRGEVQSFFDTVVEGLRVVPLDREALEPGVLEAEAQGRTPSTMSRLLAMQYGAAGPGLADVPEFALAGVGAEELQSWVRDRMHRGRAVLFSTADPAGFDLSGLPAGPTGAPWTLPDMIDGPGWVGGNASGFATVAVVARSTATATMTRVLRDHVLDAMRTAAGVTYAVDVTYEPLTPIDTIVGLFVDAASERQVGARDRLLEALDRFVEDGPDQRWLTLDRQRMARMQREPNAGPGLAFGAAERHLLGEVAPLERGWVDEYAELTTADLATAARRWRSAASWMVPDAAPMPLWRRLPRLRLWHDRAVDGRDLVASGEIGYRLVAGQEGLSVIYGQDRIVTAPFADVVAVEVWDDGSRLLHTRDGLAVAFDSTLWREGPEFVSWLDVATGPAPRISRGARSP